MKNTILGIDPGSNIMGYGILQCEGNKQLLLAAGVIQLTKIKDSMAKMHRIYHDTTLLIEKHKPNIVAIEAPFFGKNVQSMLKLGRAQGIAIAAALSKNLQVYEYAPRKIKMSITGKGTASKEQVAAMIQRLLSLQEMPDYLDTTDAIAVALCHHFQNGKQEADTKKYSSWDTFLSQNPDRKI